MKIINVEKIKYDNVSGFGTLSITDTSGGKSTLKIYLKAILPFVNLVSKEVFDFFILSAAVYGIDRFVERKQCSVDGWSRELNVIFPVHNPSKWKATDNEVSQLLSFLTGDYWQVSFREETFNEKSVPLDTKYLTPFEQVNLLSGGLDSLIGALDFLEQNTTKKVLFVSHYDSHMHGPKGDQKELISELKKMYPNQFEFVPSLKVSLEQTNVNRETTFRSRSLLFIGIALIVAQATKSPNIIVPENGSVSLNFPLSSSRRSSCSTRTTHPFVLDRVISVLNTLSITTEITNPYEFKTKGEMVAACKDQTNLLKLVGMSNSCGKRGHRTYWGNKSATHCGVCMPCVYRQASLMKIKDETVYADSINSLIPFNTKKSWDLSACLDFLKTPITKNEIKRELIINGVKNLSKLDQFSDVVIRTRRELNLWVKKEGNVAVKNKAGI